MSVEVVIRDGIVAIEGEMTIYFAGELKSQLLAALQEIKDDTLVLDLSRVSELDTAGLQMLLMARAHATAAARTVKLHAPSSAVLEVLGLCGLQGWLKDSQAEAA